jgi:hypothetical protein
MWRSWLDNIQVNAASTLHNPIVVSTESEHLEEVYLVCRYCDPCQIIADKSILGLKYTAIVKSFEVINKNILRTTWSITQSKLDKQQISLEIQRLAKIDSHDISLRTIDNFPSLNLVLLQTVLPNASLKWYWLLLLQNGCKRERTKGTGLSLSSFSNPVITIGKSHETFLSVEETSFRFITCYNLNNQKTFVAYFLELTTAFDQNCWALIFISVIMMATGVWLVSKLSDNNSICTTAMGFIGFSHLLEQGNSLIAEAGGKRPFLICILGAWFLACLVLTNAYKGHTIQAPTKPTEPESVKTYSQLVANGFLIYTRPHDAEQYDLAKFYGPCYVSDDQEEQKTEEWDYQKYLRQEFSIPRWLTRNLQPEICSNTSYFESIANISTVPQSFEEIAVGNKSFVRFRIATEN